MAGNSALNSIQQIMGCDMHKQIPPPPPAGPVPAPHIVVAVMSMAHPGTTQASTTVKAGAGYALGRQHDLGMGQYHVAVNALLPLVNAGAANKAEFGSASVSIGACGASHATLRIAVALIPIAGVNLQLDCNEPYPQPRSICDASLNTVFAGFGVADAVAGFAAMGVDIAISRLVDKVAGMIVGGAGTIAIEGLGEVLALLGPEAMLIGALGAIVAGPVIKDVAKLGVGWLIGTPLSYSYMGAVPLTGGLVHFGGGSKYGGNVNDYLNDLISPTPTPPAPSAGSSTSAGPSSPSDQDDPTDRNDEE